MFILLLVMFVADCFPVHSYGEQIENVYILHERTLVMFYVVVRIVVFFLKDTQNCRDKFLKLN